MADYIRNFVVDVLLEFGLQKEGNIFVTDNAANMKAAFREMTWIGCAGHNLNLVLSHALQPSTGDDPEYALPEEVATLITTCKVTLLKRLNINNKLDSTLKQCVSTRWNSILTMLTSADKSKAQLRATTHCPPRLCPWSTTLRHVHHSSQYPHFLLFPKPSPLRR